MTWSVDYKDLQFNVNWVDLIQQKWPVVHPELINFIRGLIFHFQAQIAALEGRLEEKGGREKRAKQEDLEDSRKTEKSLKQEIQRLHLIAQGVREEFDMERADFEKEKKASARREEKLRKELEAMKKAYEQVRPSSLLSPAVDGIPFNERAAMLEVD